MLISLHYPHGQRATHWQKNILAGAEALEIIPSTRRIGSAIAARFFAEKSLNLDWGVTALSEKDLAELQRIFDTLSTMDKAWYVPEYTVQSIQLFDMINDVSKQRKKKARIDRVVRFAAPLYLQIHDPDQARLIAQHMADLPYLGRSESIVMVKLHDDTDVDLSKHRKYLPSQQLVLKSIHSIELAPGCSVEDVIDTAPLAKWKVGPTSKLAMPKGCEDIWWFPEASTSIRTTNVRKPSNRQRLDKTMLLECSAPLHLASSLTMALLERIRKMTPNMNGFSLIPVPSSSGMEILGWRCQFESVEALLSFAEIGNLRLSMSSKKYHCSLIGMPTIAQPLSTRFRSITPVLLENCDTLEEAYDLLLSNEIVASVEITEIEESTMGTALTLSITTTKPLRDLQLGAIGHLGMGHFYPLHEEKVA